MVIVISYTLPLSLFRFIILNEFYPKNVAVITQVTTLLTKGSVHHNLSCLIVFSLTYISYVFLFVSPFFLSFFLPLPLPFPLWLIKSDEKDKSKNQKSKKKLIAR